MLRTGKHAFRQVYVNTPARWQSTKASPVRTGSKSWRFRRTYIFPILLFSAVSSLAINVRNAKDDYRLLEDQHGAQLSVLSDLQARLRAGETLHQQQLMREYERVGIIKRTEDKQGKPSMHITWRETLFGRKKEERDLAAEKQELADIERALQQADETASAPDFSRSLKPPTTPIVQVPPASSSSRTSPTESRTDSKAKHPTVLI